jgi:hypothetical protein
MGIDGHLREPLIHYNYRTMAQFTAKQHQYVAYEAAILYKQGVRPKPWTYLFSRYCASFIGAYIILRGYHDGWFGLVLCAWVAYYYGFVSPGSLGRLWR